ncbi:hypothetical protein DPEC_G00335360 [Dallia pectoralis]|uniref:Uncharacterized protein n=1 Tax=Dallia pectoralis TaxID=75939 RepID=A0ACC2F749_DALPE|nr:hypothetical protein DPEC_G00335360 [Dallia pectoralis]
MEALIARSSVALVFRVALSADKRKAMGRGMVISFRRCLERRFPWGIGRFFGMKWARQIGFTFTGKLTVVNLNRSPFMFAVCIGVASQQLERINGAHRD